MFRHLGGEPVLAAALHEAAVGLWAARLTRLLPGEPGRGLGPCVTWLLSTLPVGLVLVVVSQGRSRCLFLPGTGGSG